MDDTKRVLYVEDEKFFGDTLNKLLTHSGYTVMVAEDGEKGLELAKSFAPHLILLDIILPKVDGKEVLKTLKADPTTKQIPVIVLSNLNSEDDVKKMTELGALHFYVKAMTLPTSILAAVKDAIGAGVTPQA